MKREIIDLIIESNKKLVKIKEFFVNFTMPTLIESLSKDFSLSKDDVIGIDIKISIIRSNISKKLESVSMELLERLVWLKQILKN